MSRDSKRSGNERLKYGICLNDECSKCRSKEIQSFPLRKEMVCEECGKELRECAPPKKKGGASVVLILIAVAAIAAGAVLYFVSGEKDTASQKIEEDVVIEEVVDVTETVTEEIKTVPADAGNTTLSLSYGNYSGAIKNGYPHGQGKLTYTKTRVINRHDMKNRQAKPGDYIIGEFFNGFVVYGKLYDSNGNMLGSLNFGVSNEDSYESK